MAGAGRDHAAYLARHPNRYRRLHIKDFQPTATPSVGLDDSSRPKPGELGHGHIDYRSIFTTAKKAEVEWYYMEQERPYTDMPP